LILFKRAPKAILKLLPIIIVLTAPNMPLALNSP
jgi:hypothetical protein